MGRPAENLIQEGYLKVEVYDNDVGKPIDSANVRISPTTDRDSVVADFATDSSGQTPYFDLPAPPVEFSMNEDSENRPYSEYNVTVSMDGFDTVVVEGVQILPDAEAIQEIFLRPQVQTASSIDTIPIEPHTLWGTYPPKIPESDVKELPPSKGFVVLPDPVIPQYIVVHAGAPSDSSAKNYWIPFKDYIKNVASSEIYANWPEATIRANILAIISFTLNRVYTEWYRGKGYTFTITSSTAYDHAFTYGRNIFSEISRVVDSVFSTFITKPGIRQPLLTQYCDGKKSQCPNWMTQWGSKSLGDKGYSDIDILKTYYGYDIFLMQAKSVQGVPISYPGQALQLGSRGSGVRTIQTQLNAISNNYPAIPKLKVDGIYGQNTLNAVSKFQSIFQLPSSGIVDYATWYKISNIYTAVTRLAELK